MIMTAVPAPSYPAASSNIIRTSSAASNTDINRAAARPYYTSGPSSYASATQTRGDPSVNAAAAADSNVPTYVSVSGNGTSVYINQPSSYPAQSQSVGPGPTTGRNSTQQQQQLYRSVGTQPQGPVTSKAVGTSDPLLTVKGQVYLL